MLFENRQHGDANAAHGEQTMHGQFPDYLIRRAPGEKGRTERIAELF